MTATPLAESAVQLLRRLHGERDHSDVAQGLNNLAGVYQAQGLLDKAAPLLVEALAMNRRLHGERDHSDVATGLFCLAALLHERGRLWDAEQHARQAVAMFMRCLPPGHPNTKKAMGWLRGIRGAMRQRRRWRHADGSAVEPNDVCPCGGGGAPTKFKRCHGKDAR